MVLLEAPLSEEKMASIAAEVGYSETVFAVKLVDSKDGRGWRVRYFSPESEVPFCGHATIALGAVLGQRYGDGSYSLTLNDALISVAADTTAAGDGTIARLQSPPTQSRNLSTTELQRAMSLFNLVEDDLDTRLPPALIHAGANHIMLALKDRCCLASMTYDLNDGCRMMRRFDVATIMLVFVSDRQLFHVRNAFASGGVLEDPATGAAAAAFAGYLRDRSWPHGGTFIIHQGEDMGQPSLIKVTLSNEPGSSVCVSGRVRQL